MVETPGDAAAINRPILRSWQFWLGLVVSLASLVLALRGINISQVAKDIERVNGWWLALAALSVLVTFWLKAFRWQLLFSPGRRPSLGRSFSIQAIGMLLNTFTPARLGDLARAYLMGEAETESKFYVLGTVAVENVLDIFFLVFLVLLLFTRMLLPGWLVDFLPVMAVAVLAGIAVLGVLALRGDRLLDWAHAHLEAGRPGDGQGPVLSSQEIGRAGAAPRRKLLGVLRTWVGWAVRKARLALLSLEVFRRPGQLLSVLGCSVVSIILSASTDYLVFLALGLRTSFWSALFLLAVLQAGLFIPSSPGRIGVSYYLTMVTLVFLGVDNNIALSIGVILHLVVVGLIGIVGMLCLWWEKVTWNKLAEAVARLNVRMKKPA
jgi:glycosyltransferase 2 family protein